MQDIHDIRPPMATGFDPSLLWIIAGISAGLLLAAFAVYFIRRWLRSRKQTTPPTGLPAAVPPYEAAIAALNALRSGRSADVRASYFDLTLVLRRYIDARTQVHTVEMTSEEFKKTLHSLAPVKHVKQEIQQFVNETDPIKYSGVTAERHDFDRDISRVEQIVKGIEQQLAPPAPEPERQI